MPLTAIEDFEKLGKTNPLFKKLADATAKSNGCWNKEAEHVLLNHFNVEIK